MSMPPLDNEQIAQVREMIREGTNKAFAVSQQGFPKEKVAIEKTQADIIATTEQAVLTQQGLANQLEQKTSRSTRT